MEKQPEREEPKITEADTAQTNFRPDHADEKGEGALKEVMEQGKKIIEQKKKPSSPLH